MRKKKGGFAMGGVDYENKITVIGVDADSDALFRKLVLILGERCPVLRIGEGEDTTGYDLVVRCERDADGALSLRLIRGERERLLPYPFRFEELRRTVDALARENGGGMQRLIVPKDSRRAILDGEQIRLTESEHKLLLLLAAGNGELVTRDELAEGVFGKGAESGILNVYIHYLREKLESGGERIILSSRRGGYKIDKKYLGGESEC